MSKKQMLNVFIIACVTIMISLLNISGAFSKIKYSDNIVGTYQTENYFTNPYQFSFIKDRNDKNYIGDEGTYYLRINGNNKQGTFKKYSENVYILDDGEEKQSIFFLDKTIHFYDKEIDLLIELDKVDDVPTIIQ